MSFQGLVVRWFGEKKFGFISYEHGGQQLEAFFSRRSVCADWKGSRAWATGNAVVVFDLDGKQTEGQKRPAATNVTQCFVDNEERESLETYREVSRVGWWISTRRMAWASCLEIAGTVCRFTKRRYSIEPEPVASR